MPAEAAPLRAEDPRTLGEYRLIGRLATGERRIVYLGRDPSGRTVVIHRIVSGTRAPVDEVLAKARAIDSPAVPRVLGGGVEAGGAYLVSEHLRAPSLAEAVRRHGPCTPQTLHRLAVGVIEGLAAVHRAGLVHGGLRPETILLGPHGPCITDAAVTALAGPEPGDRRPAYKAPEHLYGGEPTGAADVFAWAAVMIYAFCGRPPFGPDEDPATLTRILRHRPDPGPMPGRLPEIVLRCLVKDPRLRPSAADVARWLRRDAAPPPAPSPRRTVPDPLPVVEPRYATRPPESPAGTGRRRSGGVEVRLRGRDAARRRTRDAARRRRAARGHSLLAGLAAGAVATAALVVAWQKADSVHPADLTAGGPAERGMRAGPTVTVTAPEGRRYRLSAIGWGTGTTVHAASPADDAPLYAEYALGNPTDRPAPLDLHIADVFIKRDLLPEGDRGRCMWHEGVPEDMCAPPSRPQVTARLAGGSPGGADDRSMAPRSWYTVRVTVDVPVEQDPRPGDLRLYVWRRGYLTAAPVTEVPFPR